MGSGSISLSAGSATISQTELSGLSGFSLETGPVADQTFAGTGYTPITPALYIGQGNYNTIFNKTFPYVDPLANANGLPTYYWYQVVNLLYNIDTTVQEDLNCVNRVGGQCSLANACASYAPLWQFSFKVQFTG